MSDQPMSKTAEMYLGRHAAPAEPEDAAPVSNALTDTDIAVLRAALAVIERLVVGR